MIPFNQTSLWANSNEYLNNLKSYTFSKNGISCLFGYDVKERSLTSWGGPVISAEASPADFKNFLETLLNKIKQENISIINFRALFALREWGKSYENVLTQFQFKKQEWKTLIIDLCVTEEQLFKNLQHAARKGIKKAQQLGVKIKRCSTFEDYYTEFLIPCLEIKDRPIKEKSVYEKLWELDTQNCYNYWVAKDAQREVLGFLGSYNYDGIVTEVMSALTPIAWQRKMPVQDLLHWEIITYHKNRGDLYFDLAGINPYPVSEKEKNIKRFKEKWGGVEYDVSSYVLDTRSPIKKLFDRVVQKIHG